MADKEKQKPITYVLQFVFKYKVHVLVLVRVPIVKLRYLYLYPLITKLQVLVKYSNTFQSTSPHDWSIGICYCGGADIHIYRELQEPF